MNRSEWLARLLGVGAFLETGAGLGLLVAPSALSSLLLGSPLTGAGLVMAHVAGGALLGLGIACWYARGTPTAPAGLGASRAFLAYNVVVCVALAMARPAPPGGGLAVLAAAALHGLLAVALLAALFGRSRPSSAP